MLLQREAKPFPDLEFVHQKLCRLVCQIVFIDRKEGEIRPEFDPGLPPCFQRDNIIEIDRLHHHPHIMVSVLPSPQHIQAQIDLAQRS